MFLWQDGTDEVEMQELDSSKPLIITNPKAAQILTDVRHYAFLEPFFGQEQTISEVAAKLEMRIDAIFYRVKRYCELGILRITRTDFRMGREINLYSAAPTGYFVPLTALPTSTLSEWISATNSYFESPIAAGVAQAVHDLVDQSATVGFNISEKGPGKISVQLGTPSTDILDEFLAHSGPAVLNTSTSLYLDHGEAKLLQYALMELLQKHQTADGNQQYFVRIGFAPVNRYEQ